MEQKERFIIREKVLELTHVVKVTKEVHKLLRRQRVLQQKSMARIINDLIIKEYKT